MRRALLLAIPAFALLLFTGCGSGGATVSGQVNFGDTKLGADDKLTVTLSDGKNTYSSDVDSAGSFKCENVASGSYTVTVIQYKMGTAGGEAKPGAKPTGPGAPDMKTYPESFKVPGGPYTIDMSKIAPTKKK